MKRALFSGFVAAFSISMNYDLSAAVYNDHEYRLTSRINAWEAAEAESVARGGHLVAINDPAEESFVNTVFGTGPLWNGLNDIASEGTWVWTSGDPVTYTNWNPGEPNNTAGHENAVVMNWPPGGAWNDIYQNDSFYSFNGVIERQAPLFLSFDVTLDAYAKLVDGNGVVAGEDSQHLDSSGIAGVSLPFSDGHVDTHGLLEVVQLGPPTWLFSGEAAENVFFENLPPDPGLSLTEWQSEAKLDFHLAQSFKYDFSYDPEVPPTFSPELGSGSGILGPGDYFVDAVIGASVQGVSPDTLLSVPFELRLTAIPDGGSSGLLLLCSISGMLGLSTIYKRGYHPSARCGNVTIQDKRLQL